MSLGYVASHQCNKETTYSCNKYTVTAIGYTLALDKWSLSSLLQSILYMVFTEFILTGLIVATVQWCVCLYFNASQGAVAKAYRTLINAYLLSPSLHSVSQQAEWGYCFDVHCNAFVPWFMLTYVCQLLLLGVLMRDGVLSLILSNGLYLIASGTYWYITFLGYSGVVCLVPRKRSNKAKQCVAQ